MFNLLTKKEDLSTPLSIHTSSKETLTRRNKPEKSETINLIKNFFSHATLSATENPGGKKVKWIPEGTPNSPLHTSPRPEESKIAAKESMMGTEHFYEEILSKSNHSNHQNELHQVQLKDP